MIRVLHVVTFLGRGGLEVWLTNLLKIADKERYYFDVVVQVENEGLFDQQIRDLGFKVIPCLGKGNPLKFSANFYKILREYGPYDVVHSHIHHFSAFPLLVAKLSGVKACIAHSHSNPYENRKSLSRIKRIYLALTEFTLNRVADFGLGVSSLTMTDLYGDNWQTRSDRQVLHCGIDLAPFEKTTDRTQMCQALGIAPDKKIVGHIGRFIDSKNHALIFKIARQILLQRNDIVFLLVGNGPLLKKYQDMIDSDEAYCGKVFLTGDRSDVSDLLSIMNVFLFPSLFEGLGLALVEAQAAGLPCVIADTIPVESYVVREQIQVLSLASPTGKWSEAILENIDSKEKKFREGLNAVRHSSHNLDTSLVELMRLYESLL